MPISVWGLATRLPPAVSPAPFIAPYERIKERRRGDEHRRPRGWRVVTTGYRGNEPIFADILKCRKAFLFPEANAE